MPQKTCDGGKSGRIYQLNVKYDISNYLGSLNFKLFQEIKFFCKNVHETTLYMPLQNEQAYSSYIAMYSPFS